MTFLNSPNPSIVALAAHPDDIEIGAAGTLMSIAESQPGARFHYICMTGGKRKQEAIDSAQALFGERCSIHIGSSRDSLLPYDDPIGAKEWLRSVTTELNIDMVFTPALHDRHQDHHFVASLAWQLFRDSTIIEFDIPKWEGDRLDANLYVPLSDDIAERKLIHLEKHFPSQQAKPWYDRETFAAAMRLRGIETGAAGARYAEGFRVRKILWAATTAV